MEHGEALAEALCTPEAGVFIEALVREHLPANGNAQDAPGQDVVSEDDQRPAHLSGTAVDGFETST